jgi:hypothetical protein
MSFDRYYRIFHVVNVSAWNRKREQIIIIIINCVLSTISIITMLSHLVTILCITDDVLMKYWWCIAPMLSFWIIYSNCVSSSKAKCTCAWWYVWICIMSLFLHTDEEFYVQFCVHGALLDFIMTFFVWIFEPLLDFFGIQMNINLNVSISIVCVVTDISNRHDNLIFCI